MKAGRFAASEKKKSASAEAPPIDPVGMVVRSSYGTERGGSQGRREHQRARQPHVAIENIHKGRVGIRNAVRIGLDIDAKTPHQLTNVGRTAARETPGLARDAEEAREAGHHERTIVIGIEGNRHEASRNAIVA